MLGIGYVVRHYAWGSPRAIPDLLGIAPDGRPWAELWLGDHPAGPAPLAEPDGVPFHLSELIRRDPATVLGPDHARWGDRLPYLLKVLAVEAPLSLQVHPDLRQARAGYEREEAAGLPSGSPQRNYRDANHKPEMVLALTEFEALAGFRPASEARAALTPLDCSLARAMSQRLAGPDPIRQTMALVLASDLAPADVAGLVEACAKCRAAGAGDVAGYTVVRLLARHYPGDPGVAVSLLMRRRVLAPGEVMVVPAGTIHSYLRGVAVEVMAASDNVLRAGLTPKHVDIPEVLAAVDYSHAAVPRPREEGTGQVHQFLPPVADFRLADVRIGRPAVIEWSGPRIGLVLQGEVFAACDGHRRRIGAGEAVFFSGLEGPVSLRGSGRMVVAAPGE
jgi:mannose-6-phosphate isomerase